MTVRTLKVVWAWLIIRVGVAQPTRVHVSCMSKRSSSSRGAVGGAEKPPAPKKAPGFWKTGLLSSMEDPELVNFPITSAPFRA